MITPDHVLPIWTKYHDALKAPVARFAFPKFGQVFDDTSYQMGVINMSTDSVYRESLCHNADLALYRARKMTVEGARIIDIGAESTGDTADLVSINRQIDTMRPVVQALSEEGMLVSVETYHPEVAIPLLEAGAGIINLTGRVDDKAFYEDIARHEGGVIMCYTPGENARSADDLPPAGDLIDDQLAFFRERVSLATGAGVERLWVDPGFGFALNLRDGEERVRYQTDSTLQCFRLRELGWPVAVTLTSSVHLFRDEITSAETFSAALAVFSKANLLRSHEIAKCEPIIRLLSYDPTGL
ncbi:MAG: dihydropteroate synthase [Pseudomonadota bacterium]